MSGEGQSSLEVHVWHEGCLHTVSMEPELQEYLHKQHPQDPLLDDWEEQMTLFLWQLHSVTHVPVEFMRLVGMAHETVFCGEAEAAYLKQLYKTVPAKHCHSFLLTDNNMDDADAEFQASRKRHFSSLVFEAFLQKPEIVVLDARRSFFGIIDDSTPSPSSDSPEANEKENVKGLVIDAEKNSGGDNEFVSKCRQIADTCVEECSKIRFGNTPVVQPIYKVEIEDSGVKSSFSLCGACASTCISPSLHASPKLIHEDSGFINHGFVCQISQLELKHGDKGIMDLFGDRSGECIEQAEEARCILWSRFLDQQRSMSTSYLQETELKLQNSHGAGQAMQSVSDMNKRIQSVKSSVSLYEESYIQHKALVRLPLTDLYGKASSFLSERLYEADGDSVAVSKSSIDSMYPLFFRFRLLKEITNWFKSSFFKWVNSPTCSSCDGKTEAIGGSPPQTQEEKEGKAGIVEVYRCKSCSAINRFPRYNHPATLLDWRKGRCGEWANCFTQICIAVGYESRYICDWTDHVWTEVWLPLLERWVHVDCCENAVDAPLTYESGWGKKLTYVIGISPAECVDVTRRYTKKWEQVLNRRDATIEHWLRVFLLCFNFHLKSHFRCIENRFGLPYTLSPQNRQMERTGAPCKLLQVFATRRTLEEIQLSLSVAIDLKARSREEQQGRISGSLEWRQRRNETGQDNETNASSPASKEDWFLSRSCASESEWLQLHPKCVLGGLEDKPVKNLVTFGSVLIGLVESENRFVWGALSNLQPAEYTMNEAQQQPQWRTLEVFGVSFRIDTPNLRGESTSVLKIIQDYLCVTDVSNALETLSYTFPNGVRMHLDMFEWPPNDKQIISSATGFSAELFVLLSDGGLWLLCPANADLKNSSSHIGKTAWTAMRVCQFTSPVFASSEIVVEGSKLTLATSDDQIHFADIFSWAIDVGSGTKKLQNDVSYIMKCVCNRSGSLPSTLEGAWDWSRKWVRSGCQRNNGYSAYFSLPFFAKDIRGFPIFGFNPSSSTVGLRMSKHEGLSAPLALRPNNQLPCTVSASVRNTRLECVLEAIIEKSKLCRVSNDGNRVRLLQWPFVIGDWIGLHRIGSRSEDASLLGFSCLQKPMKKLRSSSNTADDSIEPLKHQLDLQSFLGNNVVLLEELPRLQHSDCSEDLMLSFSSVARHEDMYLEGTEVAADHNTSTVRISFQWPECRMSSVASPLEFRLHRRTPASFGSEGVDCVHAGNSTGSLYETVCTSNPVFLPSPTEAEFSSKREKTAQSHWVPLVRAPAHTISVSSTKTSLLALCNDDTADEGHKCKWFSWKLPSSFEQMCRIAASAATSDS